MYDYATATKQNQILTQIEQTNENIENMTLTIKEQGLMICVLITIIIIEKIVKICTGGRW